jgi:maleylpyruvate isomerase
MELFSYHRSSAAYRVRIALNMKQIEHDIVPVNLLESEQKGEAYKAINPQGLVPCLRLATGQVIAQSTAILEFLEERHRQVPLLPKDDVDRATVRAWVNTIACDIHPLNNLRVLKYLQGELAVEDDAKNAWYAHWISAGFAALEAQVAAKPYCFGANITMADVYLIPQIYNALRFKVDMTPFPKLMGIYETCNRLDAFHNAAPEQQAG